MPKWSTLIDWSAEALVPNGSYVRAGTPIATAVAAGVATYEVKSECDGFVYFEVELRGHLDYVDEDLYIHIFETPLDDNALARASSGKFSGWKDLRLRKS